LPSFPTRRSSDLRSPGRRCTSTPHEEERPRKQIAATVGVDNRSLGREIGYRETELTSVRFGARLFLGADGGPHRLVPQIVQLFPYRGHGYPVAIRLLWVFEMDESLTLTTKG